MRKFLALVGAAFLALTPLRPAFAQIAVIDGSNLAKNALTAAQTAQQYTQMIKDYLVQIDQYQAMLKNLATLDSSVFDSSILRGLSSAASGLPGDLGNDVRAMAGAGKDIYGTYRSIAGRVGGARDSYAMASFIASDAANSFGKMADFSQDMNAISGMTNMTWEQIIARDKEQASGGMTDARNRYVQAYSIQSELSSLKQRSDNALRKVNEPNSGGDLGVVTVLQGIGVQLHTLTDGVSQLIALTAAKEASTSAKDQQAIVNEEARKAQTTASHQKLLEWLKTSDGASAKK